MGSFRTFCIVPAEIQKSIASIQTDGNTFTFKPDPTKRFWESIDGKSSTILTVPDGKRTSLYDEVLMNEVFINVEEEPEASAIMSIIKAGMLLGYPHPSLAEFQFILQEVDSDFPEILYGDKWYGSKFNRYSDFDLGVLTWQKAHTDKKRVYALEKYKLSLTLSSFSPSIFSPKYGRILEHYENETEYHTEAAFAIIAAFSAIEELGLEIRSSQKKPRFTDNQAGTWNDVVLADVYKRLADVGISADSRIDWIYRGYQSEIELQMTPYFGVDSEWVDKQQVRDKSLTYPEAIHNASYLRNFIAAHKFNELTKFLSPYDVFNVQNLLRSLLLHELTLRDFLDSKNS